MLQHSASPRTRRQILAGSIQAAAGCLIVSPEILGGPGKTPPSDQFRFVQIGAGGKGATDLKQTIKAGGKAIAICDIDVQRAGKTYAHHPELKRWTDYRGMLETYEDEFDAVVISTPDHGHGVQGLDALRRGKHVYLQKPLARTLDECQRLAGAAAKAKVATQMGNQGHSGIGLRVYRDWIGSGQLGKIKEVHCWTNRPIWPQGMTSLPAPAAPPNTVRWDLWLGPAAERPFGKGYLPFAWRGWWDFGCGAMGDMACHNMDPAFATLQLGMPTQVTAQCEPPSGISYPSWSIVRFRFPATPVCPDGIEVVWYDGDKRPDVPSVGANEQADDPGFLAGDNGCMIVGEKMTIAGGSHAKTPEVIAVEKGMDVIAERRRMKERVAQLRKNATDLEQLNHYERWIHAAKTGESAVAGSDFKYAANMTGAILLGCVATRFPDQELFWNNEAREFTGLDQANELLKLNPREGYDLSF